MKFWTILNAESSIHVIQNAGAEPCYQSHIDWCVLENADKD